MIWDTLFPKSCWEAFQKQNIMYIYVGGNANHHSVNLVITTSKILVKRFIQLLRSGFWSACSIINGNNFTVQWMAYVVDVSFRTP